jgi:hypothetical protein
MGRFHETQKQDAPALVTLWYAFSAEGTGRRDFRVVYSHFDFPFHFISHRFFLQCLYVMFANPNRMPVSHQHHNQYHIYQFQ